MLEIYSYTVIHSQLSNQICDKIGLQILHVLHLLIWAFYTTLIKIGFRLWVFLGPDSIYRYYFEKCSSELATLVLIPYGYQCSSHCSILIGCMIFLSLFLDIVWVPMPTASFLIKLKSGIPCLHVFLVCGVRVAGLSLGKVHF